MRKLTTLRRIKEIRDHPNADKLELAIVDGWQVVVVKGKHYTNEQVLFFEIDSFLPVRPEFEFLRKSCYRNIDGLGEGFRIKTIRLRQQVSQGLIMSLEDIQDEQFQEAIETHDMFIEDMDFSEMLGVKKYEKPIPASLSGKARGNFPSFIPKTDQKRIENCFESLKGLASDTTFEVSLKLDGSSMTAYYYQGKAGVCSRNLDLDLSDDTSLFVRTFNRLQLSGRLRSYCVSSGIDIAIQGELMGPSVQGNREGFVAPKFFVFDIFNITKQEYLNPKEVQNLCKDVLCLDHVPVIADKYPISIIWKEGVDGLKEIADNIRSINNKVAEGLVFKSETDDTSFKVISPKYLLSGGN